jgi:hypothetical protein
MAFLFLWQILFPQKDTEILYLSFSLLKKMEALTQHLLLKRYVEEFFRQPD